MIEPVFQGLRAEQMRERQRERPHLEDRHVGDRGLGALRQDEGHALAAPDAESRERVRQAVCRRLDVPERVGGGGARLVLPIEREARAVFRPSPAARARDVVALRDLPTEALIELVVAIDHRPKQFNIGKMPIGALVFDAYGTLFDVHSVVRRCEGLWPGKGAQLSQLWRAKQPEVYALALKKLKIPKERIGFVSSNCWDALGAKSFGFTVYWINRLGAPVERLGFTPDKTINSLLDLA